MPTLPFLQGIELKKFMLRQMAITEMFKNERLAQMDLVVMGSHGARGLRGVVGSNTQKVVRIAPMPVLVIKHQIDDFQVNDMVYASNFTPDGHREVRRLPPGASSCSTPRCTW